MKSLLKFVFVIVVLLLASSFSFADEGVKFESYSLWIGGHYTDFTDYTKKVGEYDLGDNETLPEFSLNYLSVGQNSIMRFVSHYYDSKNAYAKLNAKVSDKLKFSMQYRSLLKQEGQDLLDVMSAQEYLPAADTVGASPNSWLGGKMLTHDIQDPGADYNTYRQELLTQFSVLLSEKNNVRFNATHRMILKTGTEQKIASSHCFACHLTSMEGEVNNTQHQLELGVDAEVGSFDVGYQFGYRLYDPKEQASLAYYDNAMHPIKAAGTAAGEFGPRLIYEDVEAEFSVSPKTEKMSHKVKFKRNLGNGYLAGSIGYASAENKYTELKNNSYSSAFNYATFIDPNTKLIAKVAISKLDSDSIYIDLPTFREDLSDSNYVDFDFTRYSALNRTNTNLSAELIKRMNKKLTVSGLLGYDMVNRDDYPVVGDGTSTKKLYLQAKFNYRKSLYYRSSLKIRFEKISDPFVSGKGLFESSGEFVLDPLTGASIWVFYFQREDLRYQDITTSPTQVMSCDWNMSYNPGSKLSLTMGLKGKMDKNDDLDSLDVEHSSFIPSISIMHTPSARFSLQTGYSYNYDKSRLPIAVALFDG